MIIYPSIFNITLYLLPRYKANAMALSKRFKDRPKTQKEEVIYWTEYVMKHRGAHHLKSYGIKLPWYKYFLIDVLAAIAFILFSIICIIVIIIKFLKRFIYKIIKLKKD